MDDTNRIDWVPLAFDSAASQDSIASGKKSPIILLHGLTNSKATWKRVIQPIAELTGRRVYAYDARNHGESGWSNEFSHDTMKEDLFKFVESLHAKRVVLIGHSMGGKTAMYFALQWPEMIEKLIIEDISPKLPTPEAKELAIKYVHLLKTSIEKIPTDVKDLSEAKKFLNKFLQDTIAQVRIGNSNEKETDSSILPLTRDKNGKYKWLANLDVIENIFIKSSPSSLKGTFKGPALFLWGTKSPFTVTADREHIVRYFPDARFRAVEGASHQIHLEYEDIFVKEVVDFINEAR